MAKYNPRRSGPKWLRLITECRQSGIPDNVWCEWHYIPVSSFYNAVIRLRKEVYTTPESAALFGSTYALDFTSPQDVVRVNICPDLEVATTRIDVLMSVAHLDTPHTIELMVGGITVKISNSADPGLLAVVFRLLKG